ncbi:hypothetical protein BC826DRAFT_158225 [Russula brevipes]|nr:hypothetical protein BC826DRAFT_158225 [Russula brevipes]
MDQLGVSEDVLRDYVSNGDSVLLANFINIARQIFRSANRDFVPELRSILRYVSQFDIQNTLPELQHDFCALWNEIVLEVQNKGAYAHILILIPIRHIYATLHQGTNDTPAVLLAPEDDADSLLYQPFSYPLCSHPHHRSDPPSYLHKFVDAKTAETTHVPIPITPSPAAPHRDTVETADSSLGNLPSAPVPTSPHSIPLESYGLDSTASDATRITDTLIPSMANLAPHSTSSGDIGPRREEMTIAPLSTNSNFVLSPVPIPSNCKAIPVELHRNSGTAVTEFDRIP